MANRLVIASSRLPVVVKKVDGKFQYEASSGGLATGVASIEKSNDSIWVGWPGIESDDLSEKEKSEITAELNRRGCHPVFLNKQQIDDFYFGYCNATLWPLFHYFYNTAVFSESYWSTYQEVNRLFAVEIFRFSTKNAQLWVHDYQLMLLPKLLRQKQADAVIGFFLHTPFPSFEIFRLLPEREELLHGLLGANLVGFHTYDYVRHFLSSVLRLLGYESSLGAIVYGEHIVQTDAFPIGIDYANFAKGSHSRSVKKMLKRLNLMQKDMKIILSVDRADYSKGIPARLDAFELFLDQNPEYLGKVHFILLAVPTRTEIAAYQDLRASIEQKISRINGEYSTTDWSPIVYRHQSVGFDELTALYSMADVMMVTPLRDGMNLVAKEFIATHHKGSGVLLLSEMAGVASEVPEALLVNPNNARQVSNAIKQSLEMPLSEQRERMSMMQSRISEYTIHKWAEDFINELSYAAQKEHEHTKLLDAKCTKKLLEEYKKAENRLILLDYDGTLRNFVRSPDPLLARPSSKLKSLLRKLNADPRNKVMIVSGRPRTTLELFFKDVGLGLIAEHGGWMFEAGHWIKSSVTSKKWKRDILPVMAQYVSRTPGSRVEEKDFSLVWHYRQVTPDLAFVRNEELKIELLDILPDEVDVFEGNKILEVKPKNMHKGALVTEMLTSKMWDFIMVIGDDYTDEDMFAVMPERAYSINVGRAQTKARYQVDNVLAVHELIRQLAKVS